jgi:hypothetical protein
MKPNLSGAVKPSRAAAAVSGALDPGCRRSTVARERRLQPRRTAAVLWPISPASGLSRWAPPAERRRGCGSEFLALSDTRL